MFVYKNVHILLCQQKMSKLLSVTQPNKKRKAISLETKYEIIEKSSKGIRQEKGKAFETLRMYLLQSKQDCNALLQELNRFEQTYEDKTAKPKTQSSIFSYFKAQ